MGGYATPPAGRRAVTRTGEWIGVFLEELAASGNIFDACRVAGICRTTAYRRKDRSQAFAAAWEAALDKAAGIVEEPPPRASPMLADARSMDDRTLGRVLLSRWRSRRRD